MISRRELRPFRLLLKRRRELKRCRKRLQFHCAIGEDQKISEQEWNSYLGVASKGIHGKSFVFGSIDNIKQIFYIFISESFLLTSVSHRHLIRGPVSTKRRGPNPLKTWLKADDQFLNLQNPNLKINPSLPYIIHAYVVLYNVPNLSCPTEYDFLYSF